MWPPFLPSRLNRDTCIWRHSLTQDGADFITSHDSNVLTKCGENGGFLVFFLRTRNLHLSHRWCQAHRSSLLKRCFANSFAAVSDLPLPSVDASGHRLTGPIMRTMVSKNKIQPPESLMSFWKTSARFESLHPFGSKSKILLNGASTTETGPLPWPMP